MNKQVRDMLIGVLLGDAHIGKTGANKAFISFEQSSKKSEYLNYLFNLMKDSGFELSGEPVLYNRTDQRYSKVNSSLYFRTESLETLRPFANMFLDKEGKKIVPANICEHLSERSLAFWIMDDGQQVKNGGVTLCTDSFKSEEVNVLRTSLLEKFSLTTTIHNKKSSDGESIYERIYITKPSLETIKPSLQEHMHKSMLYKINVEPSDVSV